MLHTLSRVNSSAATLTKNRTEGSITPLSGMCVTCVDGCVGMCEIGKSAYRGHEVIYPQPFGVTDPSVLFLVSVAADVLTLDSV